METLKQLDLAIYNSVHESTLGPKGIALELGVNAQVFRNRVNPHCDTHKVSAQEAARILEITQDPRIAEVFCDQAGGHFKRNEADSESSILESLLKTTSEYGDIARTVQEAMVDDTITLREQDAINSEITQTIDALLKLRRAVNTKTERDSNY